MLLAWPDCNSIVVLQGKDWPPILPASPRLKLINEVAVAGAPLNDVLRRGLQYLEAPRRLVLFGDLPCLSVADLDAVGAALNSVSGVVCPDRDRSGTNALAYTRGASPELAFGSDSYRRHQLAFDGGRIRPASLQRGGLAWDIDTPSDLSDLLWDDDHRLEVGPATSEWLVSARHRGVLAPVEAPARISQGVMR